MTNEEKELREKIDELIKLVNESCELTGGSFLDNLDGATNYSRINGERVKISIEVVK